MRRVLATTTNPAGFGVWDGCPRILALDLSLTAPGVVTADGTPSRWKPRGEGTERLGWFREIVTGAAQAADLVLIEGYSYGSKGNAVVNIGEMGGVVRLALADSGTPWLALPPAIIKKYATGKGNAAKPQMLTEAVRRLGYDGHDDNEADALWIWAMGMDYYTGGGLRFVPASQAAGLDKTGFPDVVATHA